MGLIGKAAVGLILSLIAYALCRSVLYDLLIVNLHPASRENTAGKRVLITGSSKGIGEALAYVYAEAGAHVTVHARKAAALVKVQQKCKQLGAASVHTVTGDMSQAGTAQRIVEAAAAAMHGLDIVIVNHILPSEFTTLGKTVLDIDSGSLQLAMQINLFSYLQTSAAAIKHLQATAGSLILVSSAAAKLPIPYCYEYCFSKRALEGFFNTFRQELALNHSKVHVGLATLGLIDTDAARVAVKREYKSDMDFASRERTARDIASMPVSRIRELSSPWFIRLPAMMRDIAADVIEVYMQTVVNKK